MPVLFDRDLRDPGLLHDADDLADALGPGLVDARHRAETPRRSSGRGSRCRSGSASSPKSASRSSSSSLAARPFASSRNVVELERAPRLRRPGRRRARRPAGRSGRSCPAAFRNALGADRAARRRPSGSGSPRERGRSPATRGSGRSARRPAANRPRRGSRSSSSRTSSRRSAAPCARSRVSIAATRPAGSSCWAARTAIRGASGVTGSSPTNSSTISAACQRTPMSTPLSIPPCERAGERFARDTVQRERDRIDGAGDQVRSGPRSVERGGEPAPGRALAIEADGQAASFGERGDELVRPVRLERAGRIVEEHARGSEVGQLLRLLDERLRLAALARAVDQARVELALRRRRSPRPPRAGSRRR